MSGGLVLCYNRGCGTKYDPNTNTSESCRFHPGHPYFHDAYKGWSCCSRKCTDFTEFLNIKGCTVSYHSNIKPEEPEKPVIDKSTAHEVIEVRAPISNVEEIERPSFDSPLIKLKPVVSESLRTAINAFILKTDEEKQQINDDDDPKTIPIGTSCKNKTCKASYEGENSLRSQCIHHPGFPVFHEGIKFWTCCMKRTTDFDSFMAQPGCEMGTHVWLKKKIKEGEVKCRVDWHQTGIYVYISIFGKKCDPNSSVIEISPVRVKIELSFPEQGGMFRKDIELSKVISVEGSSVSMNPSKIEIKLKKVGGASWSKLEIPRNITISDTKAEPAKQPSPEPQVESVDLNFI